MDKEIKIADLKAKLALTDYIAIKIAEGVATKDEYKDVLEQRKDWRQEINALEKGDENAKRSTTTDNS